MSVQTELNRLQGAKTDLKAVLTQNGVTVPAGSTLDEYPALFSAALQNGSTYLYKAAFALDSWSGGAQTVPITPMYGAPAYNSAAFSMASPVCVESGFPDETQRLVKAAGGVIDRANKTFSGSSITCTCRDGELPDCDVEVYFLAKKGT